MFTSLNVVRIAAVDCDCTSRSATRARSRDMGTRCSGREPSADGNGTAGGALATGVAGAGALGSSAAGAFGAGDGACARAPITSMTSPFVMRPPRPVPATLAGSIASSAIILRAAGKAAAPSPVCAGGALAGAVVPAVGFAGAAGGAAAGDGAVAVAAADVAALAFASVSMTAMTSFDVTVAPSGRVISASTPSPGAGSSSTTLSVSMSIRFSSRLTASPGCLCQLTSVASATDSGSCGTLTSILIGILGRLARDHHLARTKLGGERILDELLLLGGVLGGIADGGRCGHRPPGVVERLAIVEVGAKVDIESIPRTLVLRFLLAPDDLLRRRVLADLALVIVVRERILLLEAQDCDIVDLVLAPIGRKLVVDLTRADDHAPHLLRVDPVRFADDVVEVPVRKLVE